MAIATAEAVGELLSTANAATYDFAAFTPSANALLVVMSRATATAVGAIIDTGALLTWTERYADRTTPTILCYSAQVGGSPASTTIREDSTGDNATACTAVAFSITGHNQANPIRQLKVATGIASTAPTVIFDAAVLTTNSVIAACITSTNPPAQTEPLNWTEIADGGVDTPSVGIQACYRNTGETLQTIAWVSTSASAWTVIAVEINEASVGSVSIVPIVLRQFRQRNS